MSDVPAPNVPEPPRERRRLNLKPRDEAAAAKAATERNSGKQVQTRGGSLGPYVQPIF